jgi:DNA-binding NarL/FixJ family response regulator
VALLPADTPFVPSVLLVDDNALVRRLLREQLTARGALEVVAEAGDAESAVQLAGEIAPDLVVLDLSMPGSDGFAAIGELLEAAPATRVVVMSGFAAEEVADRVLAAGASAYLEKGLRLNFTDALLEVLAA